MNKLVLSIALICFFCARSNGQNSQQCFFYESITGNHSEKLTVTLVFYENNMVDVHVQEIETKGNFPINGTQDIRHAEMEGKIEGNGLMMNVSESAQTEFEKSHTEIDRLKKEHVWLHGEDRILIDGTVFKKINCNNRDN